MEYVCMQHPNLKFGGYGCDDDGVDDDDDGAVC